MMNLVDSKAIQFALDPFWDAPERMNLAFRLAMKGAFELSDRLIGRRFILDVVEFIRAFAPLFDGFRSRAEEVRTLLQAEGTRFLLVAGPGPDRVPDAMFFLRKLKETGHHLGPILVNQVHPRAAPGEGEGQGRDLLRYLADRDQRGLDLLRSLFPGERNVLPVAMEPIPPGDLKTLALLFGKLTRTVPL
jgi:anion-transporting  ArsA/GET3 family ATPase